MPLTDVRKDPTAKTVTITAEFDAPVDRAWQLCADPRQLEQWWNPPGYPLTITDHDLPVGALVRAQVATPEGHKVGAYWRITALDAPRSMEWEDGFLDEKLEPNPDMPLSTMRLTLADRAGGGTRMTMAAGFLSVEDMQEYLDMPIEEQMRVTIGQAEALLG